MHRCKICNSNSCIELINYKNTPLQIQKFSNKNNIKKGFKLKIYQCRGCEVVQLNCKPVSYYKEVMRSANVSKEMSTFRHLYFKKFIDKYDLKEKNILEIGCGSGEYLNIVKDYIKDSVGLEYSKELIKNKINSNLKIVQGFISNFKSKEKFSSFYSFSYMEHIPDIKNFLNSIKNNLNDDAVGIIEVPNFNYILENNLFYEFIRDHLFYFTKDTLKRTLEINGFEVISCNNIWHNYIISAEVKLRSPIRLDNFENSNKILKKNVFDFIKSFNGDVAIWGAGHQSLFILSTLGITSKDIKYVVDSSPTKYNKYTPTSNIKIVSPEYINTDTPKAILLIVGSYSNEVAFIIKKINKDIIIKNIKDLN
jgi:SAM-dependent methyltransferase